MLPGSNGLKDPVEKESINILDCLEIQESEDITASSQHALRLMAYRKIYKVN
jgi:zinc finger RNA-binding protein